MRYDDLGFVAGAPLPNSDWFSICGDQPQGLIMTAGVAPPGLLIIENYLARAVCDRLNADCEAAAGKPCTVYNPAPGAGITYRETAERVSENIDAKEISIDVGQVVRRAFLQVASHYRKTLRSYEAPEVLRYRTGGLYIPHADAESWNRSGRRWERSLDRDLSLLLYFNDGYEGGELMFANFGFRFKPQKGMLVAFPSDHRYAHSAEPVKSGVRYVIVSWAAASEAPRVETAPRAAVVPF